MPYNAQTAQNAIHICMISDDNYVMPTCVAITSLFRTKKPQTEYVVHIIASSLSQESQQQFYKLVVPGTQIDIIAVDQERVRGMHQFAEGSICVASVSALFKFWLPELLPALDRVLYLDGDLIVRDDLSVLWAQDIEALGGYLVAAVKESGGMYFKHEYWKRTRTYFNSGVMLLNLQRMRLEGISDKLVQTKLSMNDSMLMDQNVFNLVMDGRVWTLPIRYNYMPVSLDRADAKWSIEELNKYYNTSYSYKKDVMADACIVHYSSKDKPWKTLDGACSDWWIENYLAAPIEHQLLPLPQLAEPFGISVIMPCYNVEGYVQETLDSLFAQTYQNFELICLDDGSTDGTLALLQKVSQTHPCMKVIANENHRQGWERNQGAMLAQGKYLFFMDSDDLIAPESLERLFACAENNRLDLVLFEGDSFYENETLQQDYPQYQTTYCRKHWYPKVYTGEEMFVLLRQRGDWIVQPCQQLIRREYWLNSEIFFPELPRLEDNLYTIRAIIKAGRVKCLPYAWFHRRVRANSTMTTKHMEIEEIHAYAYLVSQVMELAFQYEPGDLQEALLKIARLFMNSLLNIKNSLSLEEQEQARQQVDECMRASDLLGGLLYYGAIERESKRTTRKAPAAVESRWKNPWARRFYKLSMKICGGIQCLSDNGVGYTVKHFFEKLSGKLGRAKK